MLTMAPPCCAAQSGGGDLDAEESPCEVDAEDARPRGLVRVLDRRRRILDACVVDEHVQGAERLLGGKHSGGPRALVGDVEAGEAGTGPELVGESGAAVGIDVADHHVRSLRVEGTHVAGALAAGPTGHEHGLVVEAGHQLILRSGG